MEGSVSFSVKETRVYIDHNSLLDYSLETRWSKFVPIKVNIMVWRILCIRIPTRWNLSQKGMKLNTLMCPVCLKNQKRLIMFFGVVIWLLLYGAKFLNGLTLPDLLQTLCLAFIIGLMTYNSRKIEKWH